MAPKSAIFVNMFLHLMLVETIIGEGATFHYILQFTILYLRNLLLWPYNISHKDKYINIYIFPRKYKVKCQSDLLGTMMATTLKTSYTFKKAKGVVGETEYLCSVALVDNKNKAGAFSYPSIVTTLETTCTTLFIFSLLTLVMHYITHPEKPTSYLYTTQSWCSMID